ncbi:MAG: biopolymer transporter ExbD [Acidobacteria bacterium]|nr:biopolymer transporter ExbD [Acidobacteriota bacterium]
MSMSTGTGSSGFNSEINVTPMVDIMLVLMIIFMVITPMLQQGVTVAIPKGDNPDEDANITKDSAVVISVPEPGQFYVGRDAVNGDMQKLVSMVKTRMDLLKPTDPHVVYLKGGIQVPYGEIVKVITNIREAGYGELGLVADKKKPGE